MTSSEAKEIADKVNQDNIDRADADLDHVLIEIQESAQQGNYSLEYTFAPDREYGLVNEIRNSLIELGYDTDIENGQNEGQDCYILNIDWSKNQ